MNDRTIIRPGGRRPRKGGGDKPTTADESDKTQIRRPSSPPADVPDEPEQQASSDRTQIRPSRGRSRGRPGANPPETGVPREKEKDLSVIDELFGSLDDPDTGGEASAPVPSAEQSSPPAESSSSSTEKTQFRPRPGGARAGGSRATGRSARSPSPQPTGSDDEKTEFRPRGPAPTDATAEISIQSSPSPAPEVARTARPRKGGREMPERRSREREGSKPPEDAVSPTSISSQFLKQSDALEGDEGVAGLVSPLLVMVGRLQSVAEHPNIEEFKEFAIDSIRYYESVAFGFGDKSGSRLSSDCSFGLCALIDEAVLSTPWGMQSTFREEGLLKIFHGDEDGDYRFFEILEGLKGDPKTNLAALELFLLLLELGFEGHYGDDANGNRQLIDLREDLFQLISANRETVPLQLSDNWEGMPGKKNPLLEYVPFWVVLSITIALMVFSFAGFNILLSRESDSVLRDLAQLGNQQIEVPNVAVSAISVSGDGPVSAEPDLVRNTLDMESLEMLLFLEIDDGTVEIMELSDKYIFRLKAPDLFTSGSHQLQQQYKDLVETIGGFLKGSNSQILVTGHTDDVPVRSLKYPSNWDLSKARAEAVSSLLAASSGLGSRVRAQGLADTDNIVPNNSDANRAINRRVEIQIRK